MMQPPSAAADPATAGAGLVRGIAVEFRRRLQGEYLPRIAYCVKLLGPGLLWQRPGPFGNSVGNLLLHLCGNTTQWILATFGKVADQRQRDLEFAADGGHDGDRLLAALTVVVEQACAVVDGLDAAELLRVRRIQQRYDETGLAAVLHVMEHFSGHAGQIYAWTKQARGVDLKFYDL
jgi:uncharacterized damage-inducible protein DinB